MTNTELISRINALSPADYHLAVMMIERLSGAGQVSPAEEFEKKEEIAGILHDYANPQLIAQEKEAWLNAAVRKHQ